MAVEFILEELGSLRLLGLVGTRNVNAGSETDELLVYLVWGLRRLVECFTSRDLSYIPSALLSIREASLAETENSLRPFYPKQNPSSARQCQPRRAATRVPRNGNAGKCRRDEEPRAQISMWPASRSEIRVLMSSEEGEGGFAGGKPD